MPIVTSGCVIRWDAAGPYFLDNSTHHNTGGESVSVEADGDLHIVQKVQGPISSMIASADETMAKLGITAGPSGGGVETTVRLYRKGVQLPADDPILRTPYLNLWMTWHHDMP